MQSQIGRRPIAFARFLPPPENADSIHPFFHLLQARPACIALCFALMAAAPSMPASMSARAPLALACASQASSLSVDAESAGQRLDNFLMRHLKGVPKTHVYRIIRSGEVRVNKARASADTRLQAGDAVRVPPIRIAARPQPAAPAREFAVLM